MKNTQALIDVFHSLLSRIDYNLKPRTESDTLDSSLVANVEQIIEDSRLGAEQESYLDNLRAMIQDRWDVLTPDERQGLRRFKPCRI